MDVFVSPLKVVNYSFVSQLLLDNKQILEKFNYSLVNIKMVELSYHCFLVFQILLIVIDQSVSFIDH